MASSPDYDPNIFIGRIVQEDWDRLMHNPLHPLTNRAITGKYPPSSTFKTIAATTFLHPPYGGLYISPYHQVKCEMEYFLHEEEEKPHKCLGYHGWINLQRAIQDSCNIYFYDGAKRIGQKRLIDMAKDFGLGHKTGIDLPGEVSGFVPTPRWKKRRLKVKWFQGDTLNLAIGQGFTNITPLQNACALAGIINDGKIYRPHILKAIYSSDNKTLIKKVDPQVKFSVDLDPVKMEIIRKGLRNVVKKGTAKHVVQPRGFTMAGKTGTADFNRRKEPHSWFVGYAPYHTAKNRVVVSVLIEEGGPGGSMAAPIACAMLRGVVNKEDRVQNIRDYLIWKVKNYYYQRRLKKIKVRKKDQKAAQKIMDQLFK
jgi:penicillin-binding protein 2